MLHITPLCSLSHTLLKDKCMCSQDVTSENCKSLVLQNKCNIEIFLSPDYDKLKGDGLTLKRPRKLFLFSNNIILFCNTLPCVSIC